MAHPNTLELRGQRGGNLIARLFRRAKPMRVWDSWAAYDQIVLEIPRSGAWSAAQCILSYDDAARLCDFIDSVMASSEKKQAADQ